MKTEDDRRLLARIDIGPSSGAEPVGCVLLYAVNEAISLVVTSRDDGDAEIGMDADECLKLSQELAKAIASLRKQYPR